MRNRAAQFESAVDRRGFTLVELLVVITIIAILFSLALVVIASSMDNARLEATRATIRHLDSALQDRIEDFERVNFKPLATRFQAQYRIDNSQNLPLELAQLMVKKDRFRAAFPQREEDLWGFDGRLGGGDDSPLLQKMFVAGSSTPRPDSWLGRNGVSADELAEAAESSELLYVALTEGAVFGPPPAGLDQIPDRHVGDTDGDGNLEFLDDWGHPLRFYNWTTRLIRPFDPPPPNPAATTAILQSVFSLTVGVLAPDVIPPSSATLPADEYSHPLNQDPDDVVGAMGAAQSPSASPQYFVNPFAYLGNTNGGQAFDETYYHAPDTYHIPLIVSGGPDELVGLYEPDASDPRTPTAAAPSPGQFFRRLGLPLAITNPADPNAVDASLLDQLYDNITNRQP